MKNENLKMSMLMTKQMHKVAKFGLAFLFVCFLGAVQVNAQSSLKLIAHGPFVSSGQAVQLLDQEIDTMTDELDQLVVDTPEYIALNLHIHFYVGVKRQLENGNTPTVADAIQNNFINMTKVPAVKPNAKSWHQEVVTLLTN